MRIEKKLLYGPITIEEYLEAVGYKDTHKWVKCFVPCCLETGAKTRAYETDPKNLEWTRKGFDRIVMSFRDENGYYFLREEFDIILYFGVITEGNGGILTVDWRDNIIAGRGQRRDPWGAGYELPWDNPWYEEDPVIDPFIPQDGYPTGDTFDSLLQETVTVWDVQFQYCLLYGGLEFKGKGGFDPEGPLEWTKDHIHELRLIRRPRGGPPEE